MVVLVLVLMGAASALVLPIPTTTTTATATITITTRRIGYGYGYYYRPLVPVHRLSSSKHPLDDWNPHNHKKNKHNHNKVNKETPSLLVVAATATATTMWLECMFLMIPPQSALGATASTISTTATSMSTGRMIDTFQTPSTILITSTNLLNNNYNDESSEGLSAITQSELGQSIRKAVIGGAQWADKWDLKWERLSDTLRDEQKCDPRTNRRMFDNGVRKDGTSIGNPVLGALCTPEPLEPFQSDLARSVRDSAREAAVAVLFASTSSSPSTTASPQRVLEDKIDQVQRLVGPSFESAALSSLSSSSSSSSTPSPQTTSTMDESSVVALRKTFNQDLYVDLRAMGELMKNNPTTNSNKKVEARSFQLGWGDRLLSTLAPPNANRKDFTSPFPKPDDTDNAPYDEGLLLDALGKVSAALRTLQSGGIIGHWEISIPEDDDWSVVTIAVDDDITIGGQILGKERGQPLDGSAVNAMVRAAMEHTAHISYQMDVFFIDPTTTNQELYNPTQLLISLSDLGQ